MEISIADQIALDDALVAPADRLKIGKCNLRLSSDVTSKEATLQVVYDVLKLTPFYKAFQVALTNEDIRNSESYKEYHAIASGKIPPKTKGSKKKADTDTTTKMKPPTSPQRDKKEKVMSLEKGS
ncbi:hypothetical protein Tco_0406965 [Tanacetum coccineum]